MSMLTKRRLSGLVAGAALAATAVAAPASAASSTGHSAQGPLLARTIFTGTSHGWSSPDDLTQVGDDFYVSFQNGVPSTGGTSGTPSQSTIVKLGLDGRVQATWTITGKCDGITADPEHGRVIATVNEDGNSSLYTLPSHGSGSATHYSYDASPLPHGGGTDSLTIYHGAIYAVASAPSSGGPALYRVSLDDGIAHLAAAPFYDSSIASIANQGSSGTVALALTDPDSSTVVPRQSHRFAGDFMLDAQGDQQAVFASAMGTDGQKLQVLRLSQAVDDTAFATSRHGALLATDSHADSVVLITGTFTPGVAYTAVTPGNANNAPPTPAPNYLGTINLTTGAVSPLPVNGAALMPHSLIYVTSPR